MTIKQLTHVNVWVHDQDEALAFYTEKLGLELRDDVTPARARRLSLAHRRPRRPARHRRSPSWPLPARPCSTPTRTRKLQELMAKGAAGGLFFSTDDCQASYEELKGRGVEFSEEPSERPYGIDAALPRPVGQLDPPGPVHLVRPSALAYPSPRRPNTMQRLTRRVLQPQAPRRRRLDPADPRRDRGRRTGLRGARPALQRARPRGLGGEPGDRAASTATAARRLPLVPVVAAAARARPVDSPGVRDELRARSRRRARKAVPRSRVAGFGSTGDRTFASRDGRTAFVYVFPPRSDDPFGGNVDVQRDLRDALRGASVGGAPVRLTGYDALSDSSGERRRRARRAARGRDRRRRRAGRPLFVFGSALAFVPLGMAISSDPRLVPAALGADGDHRGLADRAVPRRADRPRRRRSTTRCSSSSAGARSARRGLEGDEAVVAAMGTAGRAVVFSGTTVAVGLLALVVLPLPFLRSMGYGGMLIPLVATLGRDHAAAGRSSRRSARAWTAGGCAARDRSHAFWQRWSEAVVRRRWVWPRSPRWRSSSPSSGAATNLHLGNADPDTIAKAGAGQGGARRARPTRASARARSRRSRRSCPRPTPPRWSPRRRDVDGRARRRRRRRRPTGAATGRRSSRPCPAEGDDAAGRARRGAGPASTPRTPPRRRPASAAAGR